MAKFWQLMATCLKDFSQKHNFLIIYINYVLYLYFLIEIWILIVFHLPHLKKVTQARGTNEPTNLIPLLGGSSQLDQ